MYNNTMNLYVTLSTQLHFILLCHLWKIRNDAFWIRCEWHMWMMLVRAVALNAVLFLKFGSSHSESLQYPSHASSPLPLCSNYNVHVKQQAPTYAVFVWRYDTSCMLTDERGNPHCLAVSPLAWSQNTISHKIFVAHGIPVTLVWRIVERAAHWTLLWYDLLIHSSNTP